MNFTLAVRPGLELRLQAESDAEAVFRVIDANRAHLKKWLPWLDECTSIEDTQKYIRDSIAECESGESLDLGIWFENQWVGGIGFHAWEHSDRKTSIGYWLSKDFQSKGIMTDSVRTIVTYGFGPLQLNRIEIRCAAQNLKSRAIPEKLGFVQEGVLRQSEWLYDRFVDLVVYSKLQSEWSITK